MRIQLKKTASFIVVLLFISSLPIILSVQTTAAAPITIYIRADESIDLSSVPISTVDGITYQLTADISDSVRIEKDGIILDGLSHKIIGTGEYGIVLIDRKNVTIKNFYIRGFTQVISVWSSTGCTRAKEKLKASSLVFKNMVYFENIKIRNGKIELVIKGLWDRFERSLSWESINIDAN